MDTRNEEIESDNYINRLSELLSTVNNPELVSLVQRLIQERDTLSQAANVDALTGLHNRRGLSTIKNITGVLMIDIDDFKSINDTFGHDVGDDVIKTVAELIKGSARSSDYVCRYGGDEFLVAFIDCPSAVVAERAQKISADVTEKLRLKDRSITISVGVVANENNEFILDDLIKKADIAMYHSKKNGKGQVVDFNALAQQESMHR